MSLTIKAPIPQGSKIVLQGGPFPTHCRVAFHTSLSKNQPSKISAMLACLPHDALAQLMGSFLFSRRSTKTVSSRRALLAALKGVRKRGISTVDSGTVAGVVSVAAPIFGADGQVSAAVSAGGSAARLSERWPAVQKLVGNGAEELSRIPGYRGEWPNAGAGVASALAHLQQRLAATYAKQGAA